MAYHRSNGRNARKDEVNMNCKYCGYSSDDENLGEFCPECGRAWNDASGQDDTNEEIDQTQDEIVDLQEEDESMETVELGDSIGEENIQDDEEDVYEEEKPVDDAINKKKNNYTGIIAAFAGLVVVICIVAVVILNNKKKDDTLASSKTDGVETSANNDKQASESAGQVNEQTSNGKLEEEREVGDYSSYAQYVTTLGSYVGVEVSMVPAEVTDDDVAKQIDTDLTEATQIVEVTDRNTVQDGDVTNIDYTGYIDGVAFEGGASTDYNLTIGSGAFIPGFEDGLIGATVGELVNVEVTFPEDYPNTEYAGKAATFEVTVNSIKQEIRPELTDEWVAANTDYATVDEYKVGTRASLEEDAKAEMQNTKASRIIEKVLSDSVIETYPEAAVQNYVDYMISYYEYYASLFGSTLEDFVSGYFGMTLDQFNANLQSSAQVNIGMEMICYRIADEEGMSLSDEEYATAAAEFATENGYESLEAFETDYTKAQIYDRLIMNQVMDYVSANAVEVME